jgi:hypothetical protein
VAKYAKPIDQIRQKSKKKTNSELICRYVRIRVARWFWKKLPQMKANSYYVKIEIGKVYFFLKSSQKFGPLTMTPKNCLKQIIAQRSKNRPIWSPCSQWPSRHREFFFLKTGGFDPTTHFSAGAETIPQSHEKFGEQDSRCGSAKSENKRQVKYPRDSMCHDLKNILDKKNWRQHFAILTQIVELCRLKNYHYYGF